MKFCFTLASNSNPKKIWELYEDIKTWPNWEEELESISLEGDFKKGMMGRMKFKNTPIMNFELASVKALEEFTVKTIIPNVGEILFIHELRKTGNKLIIEHSVEFISFKENEDKKFLKLVSKIFEGVPKSVFSLVSNANG